MSSDSENSSNSGWEEEEKTYRPTTISSNTSLANSTSLKSDQKEIQEKINKTNDLNAKDEPENILKIKLMKPFGMKIQENDLFGYGLGAHVAAIIEDGNAAKTGLIVPGMILLSIGEINVREMDFEDVMDMLIDSPGDVPLELTFSHPIIDVTAVVEDDLDDEDEEEDDEKNSEDNKDVENSNSQDQSIEVAEDSTMSDDANNDKDEEAEEEEDNLKTNDSIEKKIDTLEMIVNSFESQLLLPADQETTAPQNEQMKPTDRIETIERTLEKIESSILPASSSSTDSTKGSNSQENSLTQSPVNVKPPPPRPPPPPSSSTTAPLSSPLSSPPDDRSANKITHSVASANQSSSAPPPPPPPPPGASSSSGGKIQQNLEPSPSHTAMAPPPPPPPLTSKKSSEQPPPPPPSNKTVVPPPPPPVPPPAPLSSSQNNIKPPPPSPPQASIEKPAVPTPPPPSNKTVISPPPPPVPPPAPVLAPASSKVDNPPPPVPPPPSNKSTTIQSAPLSSPLPPPPPSPPQNKNIPLPSSLLPSTPVAEQGQQNNERPLPRTRKPPPVLPKLPPQLPAQEPEVIIDIPTIPIEVSENKKTQLESEDLPPTLPPRPLQNSTTTSPSKESNELPQILSIQQIEQAEEDTLDHFTSSPYSFCSRCRQSYTPPSTSQFNNLNNSNQLSLTTNNNKTQIPSSTSAASSAAASSAASPSSIRLPHMLKCFHTFCSSCLTELLNQNGISITCPTCITRTLLGPNGIRGLPLSYLHMKYIPVLCGNCDESIAKYKCLQCSIDCQLLCFNCSQVHIQIKAFRQHQLIPIHGKKGTDSSNQYRLCSKHLSNNKYQDMYCLTCQVMLCRICSVFDHNEHEIITLQEGRHLQQQGIEMKQEMIRNKLNSNKELLLICQQSLIQMDNEKTMIVNEMERLYRRLEGEINERMSEVNHEIEEISNGKKCRVVEQKERVMKSLQEREEILEKIEEIIRGGDHQLLNISSVLEKRVISLNKENVSSLPVEPADMVLLSGPDTLLRSLLSTVGVINGSTHTPSPHHSYIESIHYGDFGSLWWLEIHVVVCNRDGIQLSGYGGKTSATGLSFEVYDAERYPFMENQNRSNSPLNHLDEARLMTRMKSRSTSFSESTQSPSGGGGPGMNPTIGNETTRKYEGRNRIINPQTATTSNSRSFTSRSESNEEIGRHSSSNSTCGSLVLEDTQGGYRYIFYSKQSCLITFSILIDGIHLPSSPTPYYWCNLGPSTSLFNEFNGNILYASSVLTINGWPDANSPEHLRVMNTNAGWLTEGTGLETVVVGFHAVVCLEKISLLNWAARRYQIAVRRFVANSSDDTEEWICLHETPSLTPIRAGSCKTWTVSISEEERKELGPIDALRLDICEGNNTAFYGLNVDGWILYGGRVSQEGYDDE